MDAPAHPSPGIEPDAPSPFADVRYSLPSLLKEVTRDRASVTFAMEKLDQAAINRLFRQHRLHRDAHPDQH